MPVGASAPIPNSDFISYTDFIASVLALADNRIGLADRSPSIRGSPMRQTAVRWLLGYSACLPGIVALVALTFGSAWADDADPPGVAARLSYTAGAVSIQPAGVEEWTAADLNRPFTTGDRLWTDRNSRAELQVGSLDIRLARTTGFTFLELSDS